MASSVKVGLTGERGEKQIGQISTEKHAGDCGKWGCTVSVHDINTTSIAIDGVSSSKITGSSFRT